MSLAYMLLLSACITITGCKFTSGYTQNELNDLLYEAFKNHNTELMETYIQSADDINVKEKVLLNMLELAVLQDDTPMVKFFLDHGANAKITNSNGRNLLSCARNKDIALLLLTHGVPITQNDKLGNTPMHWGGMYSIELIDLFAKYGICIDAKNTLGQTLLHRVCFRRPEQKNLEIITELIRRGAQVNVRDSSEATPLLYASMRDSEERLKLLIDAGARIDAVDDEGNSALHYAAAVGAGKNIVFLLNHGVDALAKNKKGETYLDIVNKKKENEMNIFFIK